MPTDVTKTIAATSSPTTPDYTTLQAWEDACPANLVTDDKRWIGECLNQGEFTAGITFSGTTTDATRYLYLRCATGASFKDNANVRTNALFYNSSNGVAATLSTAYAVQVSIITNFTRVEGIQFRVTGSNMESVGSGSGGSTVSISKCLFGATSSSTGADIAAGSHTYSNCLFYGSFTKTGTAIFVNGGSVNLYGCTVVRLGTASGVGLDLHYSSHVVKNTAILNFTTSFSTNGTVTGSNNASTTATVPGTSGQTSLTFANEVVDTATNFQAKSSGNLKHGTPDSTNTPDDITGLTRDATTPWIGCWEVAASAQDTPELYGRPFGRQGQRQMHQLLAM